MQWKKLAVLVLVVVAILAASLAGMAWHRAHSPRRPLPILIPGTPPARPPR